LPEEALSRIPFGPEQEQTLLQTAKWIRLIGRYQLVAGVALGAMCGVAVSRLFGGKALLGGMGFVLGTATWSLYLVWGGFLLVMVARHLNRVAETDDADQMYLAVCFQKFRQYFIFEAAFGVLAMLSSVLLIARAL
jgi:hypothetical protein